MRRFLILAVLLILGIAGLLSYAKYTSPRSEFERVFGCRLPESVTRLKVNIVRVNADSRVVEMWSKMDISLEETERMMASAGLLGSKIPFEVVVPLPKSAAGWWTLPQSGQIKDLQTKWHIAEGHLKPALATLVWTDGVLFVYYNGLPRGS